MSKIERKPLMITVRPVRSKKPQFDVVIGISGYERKAPFRFYLNGSKIDTDESTRFHALYKQICYIIRQVIKEQGEVSRQVKGVSRKQRKIHKKKIPADAYAHQLRSEKIGGC